MASRKTSQAPKARSSQARSEAPLFGGGAVPRLRWLKPIGPRVRLSAGATAPELLRVPVDDANKLLSASVRLVADLPAGSSPDVVWAQGESELLVRTNGVALACAPGLITVAVPVLCDQIAKEAKMVVPFAVGTAQLMKGLVMSTFARPLGPPEVAGVWSEALSAFAWEAVIHLAQVLSGAVGKDIYGKKLVPGSIGAEQNLLLVQPMARHDLKAQST
jgi:hypothetical protein